MLYYRYGLNPYDDTVFNIVYNDVDTPHMSEIINVLIFFFVDMYHPMEGSKTSKKKELLSVTEIGTETLIMSEKRKQIIRRTIDMNWHCI